jgi:hypothetical protein
VAAPSRKSKIQDKGASISKLFGLLLGLAGLVLAAYLSVFLVLIGGVENIINGAKTNPADGLRIVWGLVEVLFLSELVFAAIAVPSVLIAAAISRDAPHQIFNRGGFRGPSRWSGL